MQALLDLVLQGSVRVCYGVQGERLVVLFQQPQDPDEQLRFDRPKQRQEVDSYTYYTPYPLNNICYV